MHGRPSAEIVADLIPAAGVPAAVARIEDLEVEAVAEGVEPVPGALALLGSLAAGRWAVVTSASRRLAEARLAAVGIHPPTVIAADDITRGKPDPEPFLLAAARLGVAPERCVVFEDAPAGLASGRAASSKTTHRSGATPRRAAASRKGSGSGLPRVMSSAAITVGGWMPTAASLASARRRLAEVTTAHRPAASEPSRARAPGTGSTPSATASTSRSSIRATAAGTPAAGMRSATISADGLPCIGTRAKSAAVSPASSAQRVQHRSAESTEETRVPSLSNSRASASIFMVPDCTTGGRRSGPRRGWAADGG